MAGIFKATLSLCGLTLSGASEFLGVRRDTVVSWSADRSLPPEEIWVRPSDLYAAIGRSRSSTDASIDLSTIRPRQWAELVTDLETGLPEGPNQNAQAAALLLAIQARKK